jgi:glycosyltransferase involved in cell wall biosynthesis
MQANANAVPISVLVPVKNEANNLARCLDALRDWASEIVVVDSQSADGTAELAQSYGATVLQFQYQGGWPKKRQWALDTFAFRNRWILLLDADEILPSLLKEEIARAIQRDNYYGYWVRLQIYFLARQLRHGDTELWKLSLFQLGRGKFERRLEDQDTRMADMEIHEHVLVDGRVGRLREAIRHENVNSLFRYIEKHNQYSEWEARVAIEANKDGTLPPSLFGNQAQQRRWLRSVVYAMPGSPVLVFLYWYLFRLGFLDGTPGCVYCAFRAVQLFHSKAKILELKLRMRK